MTRAQEAIKFKKKWKTVKFYVMSLFILAPRRPQKQLCNEQSSTLQQCIEQSS